MKYLVLCKDQFEMMDEFEDILTKALVATFEWCQQPSYTGKAEDWKDLYKECLEESDFGDIIKVYEIDALKAEAFVEFFYCKVGDTFQLKRIL